MHEDLRRELLARCAADQQARSSLPPRHSMEEFERVVAPVDADNEQWLRGTIARYGWPGASLAGTDGAHAAWLLLQHAPLDLQEHCLPMMTAAVEAGDAAAADLAYLVDRMRTRHGEPQPYGTQYLIDGRHMRPYPIEDPEHLDERRARAGLGPYAEHEADTLRRYQQR